MESAAILRLNTGIRLCSERGDHGSRELLERILAGEEEHADWLEAEVARHYPAECTRLRLVGSGQARDERHESRTQIAFLDFEERTVYVVNADGTGQYAVHPGGLQFVAAWQPRGNRIS